MRPVSIVLSNPAIKAVETPECLSLCSGLGPEVWETGEDWLASPEAIARHCADSGDASVIQVIRAGGVPVEVRAWRAVLSCYDVYFKVRRDGPVILTDHLRNALALLPLEERSIGFDATLDHLLYRGIPGAMSYCDGLERLGLGEALTIDLKTGETARTVFDRLHAMAEPGPEERYLDEMDAAMEKASMPMRRKKGLVSLFSGGIDSTLAHSYLGQDVPALTGVAWNLSEFEKDYAAEGARLLGAPMRTFPIEEHEYLPLLEASIDNMGQPPCLDQIVIFEKAYRQEGEAYVTGNMADCLFGMAGLEGPSARIGRALSRVPGAGGLTKLAGYAPGPVRAQLARIARAANFFSQPACAPRGYAGLSCAFTELPVLDRIFGAEPVSRRLAARMEYAAECFDFSVPESDRLGRQMELAHWGVQGTEEGSKNFRHLAQSHGKEFLCPFSHRVVVESALRIPVKERYVQGTKAKFLLKRLLKRRVPDYPVDQKKGAGLFHVEVLIKNGPLKGIWDKYPLPDFFTGAERDAFLANPGYMTWNVVTFALWRDRVLNNPGLMVTQKAYRFDGGYAAGRAHQDAVF